MARRRVRQEEEASIDMTPMLDIVFIMLIFFIVTTSFVKESGIDVNRPTAATATKKKAANIFIAIKENGEIYMEKRQVDVERVRANVEKMLAETPEASVVIQADKNSKHGVVVQVMDQVKAAGVDKISVAADPGS
ncbi:ExbD/TolR family protein [Gallaecimonas pentaromativorans]|uniref:Outer membrane transport energization protein ExbD n=1 Tax=Gallaecimonas pentaromativorans TaxID=584787 RepID=A0A3N1PN54_9GAMM|nr:biopolymer transporter ExbD [Gallaecimonas pentaromativorans]MED5524395.1 biopolymer transporter ExbD [Pseudomonadota bacterium]ROQ30155.1 outer membrane transport energization protein ExbD [Gallaecimonas pentaromativorans]